MQLRVSPEALHGHSSKIVYISTEMAAASRPSGVTISDDAFGRICSFMVAPLRNVRERAEEAVEATSHALETSAMSLRTSADAFDGNEDLTVRRMGIIRGTF